MWQWRLVRGALLNFLLEIFVDFFILSSFSKDILEVLDKIMYGTRFSSNTLAHSPGSADKLKELGRFSPLLTSTDFLKARPVR
jgi:hypothetical protein